MTEYCDGGPLENHLPTFRGNAKVALTSFRSLVETVVRLHREKIVHRDIKPQNIFVRDRYQLILGDFGVVFLPNRPHRLTTKNESVGPYDYMPQWAALGERLETVEPNFDVYMLGKVLWCMVSGRLRLPREYHHRPEFDLTETPKPSPATPQCT